MKKMRRKLAVMLGSSKKDSEYLTFTALQNSSSVELRKVNTPDDIVIEYAVNGGIFSVYSFGTVVPLAKDDYVKFRHEVGPSVSNLSKDNTNLYRFYLSGKISASGNVVSLIDEACKRKSVGQYCFRSLFNSQSALVSPPDISTIETISTGSFISMFAGTEIEEGPRISATTFNGVDFMNLMFNGCSSCLRYHVATLGIGTNNMFQGNTACSELTIDAVTPPTIIASTLSGLKPDCIIYVPAESVDAYKAKQHWSDRAAYIQSIP